MIPPSSAAHLFSLFYPVPCRKAKLGEPSGRTQPFGALELPDASYGGEGAGMQFRESIKISTLKSVKGWEE